MSVKLSKLQEKLELKRQKKREKKLLKLQNAENINTADDQANIKQPIKKMNSDIKAKDTAEKKQLKNAKKQTVVVPSTTKNVETNSKKRKIADVDAENDSVVEKPTTKKRLNVLKQIEDPSQRPFPSMSTANHSKKQSQGMQPILHVANPAAKIRKVIPSNMATDEKIKKKKKKGKKIQEPKSSLPRPVFTTAGTFIEESITPYKFKSTDYKPIKIAGLNPSAVRVVQFGESHKKAPAIDFKMNALQKRSRDKSNKNIKNLM
jgi:hypothetical protein